MGSRSVLLVEDDVDIRESFQELLEAHGFEIIPASNGKEALDRLSEDPLPALVLLDMMLPVMSGNELLAVMRASDRLARVPVIILSTGTKLMGAKDLARYASTYGVAALLPKPVEPQRLVEVLRRFVPEESAAEMHA